MKKEVLTKIKQISLFLFDLEGVLIPNADSLNESELEKFIVKMKTACAEFKSRGLCLGVVTAHQKDDLIDRLAAINGCKILAASLEKVEAVNKLAAELNISFENIFYAGDEVLDIPLLKKCGLSASPKSSTRDVKRIVNFSFNEKFADGIFNELFRMIDEAKLLSTEKK